MKLLQIEKNYNALFILSVALSLYSSLYWLLNKSLEADGLDRSVAWPRNIGNGSPPHWSHLIVKNQVNVSHGENSFWPKVFSLGKLCPGESLTKSSLQILVDKHKHENENIFVMCSRHCNFSKNCSSENRCDAPQNVTLVFTRPLASN